MRKWALISLVAIFLFFTVGCQNAAPRKEQKSLLDQIQARGKVIAGVSSTVPGFGYLKPDGSYEGFEVDFAKAIAAAVLGDPKAVELRSVGMEESFVSLQTGQIDILFYSITWTATRDSSSVGLNFVPTIYYDGQGIMVRNNSGIMDLKDLEGKRIGVIKGTTTELNLTDQFRKLGVNYQPVVFDEWIAAKEAYEKGSIDAYTADRSSLVAYRTALSAPSEHRILDAVLSKEPLSPSVKGGDDKWFDAVKWILFATIQAEEFGITKDNIDRFMLSQDPQIRRFLGLEGDLGKQLGLSPDFTVKVIKAVGNYGEIYDRHLGPGTVFRLDRGLNALWTQGGLMFSPPFR